MADNEDDDVEDDDVEELTANLGQLNINVDLLKRQTLALWEDIQRSAAQRIREDVQYLYHATSKENRQSIEKSLVLKSEKMFTNFPNADKTLQDNEIKGVWFCSTLFREDLPTQSPYGANRIALPVAHVIKESHEMFFETAQHYGPVLNNQYIRFILVRNNQDQELEWCRANLPKVTINDNPFFTFDAATVRASCVKNDRCLHKVDLWVEILVIGDVQIPIGTEWTIIAHKGGGASRGASRGILSDLLIPAPAPTLNND